MSDALRIKAVAICVSISYLVYGYFQMDGSNVIKTGPVAIACMSPESRDLLNEIMDAYTAHYNEKNHTSSPDQVYQFAYWLCRWSGLIRPSLASECPVDQGTFPGALKEQFNRQIEFTDKRIDKATAKSRWMEAHNLEIQISTWECAIYEIDKLIRSSQAKNAIQSDVGEACCEETEPDRSERGGDDQG